MGVHYLLHTLSTEEDAMSCFAPYKEKYGDRVRVSEESKYCICVKNEDVELIDNFKIELKKRWLYNYIEPHREKQDVVLYTKLYSFVRERDAKEAFDKFREVSDIFLIIEKKEWMILGDENTVRFENDNVELKTSDYFLWA